MDNNEVNLLLAIKSVGLPRAKDIFAFVEAWEGNVPPVKESKELRKAEHIGNAILASFPSNKRGRPIEPNSARQRVFSKVLETLSDNPEGVRIRHKFYAFAEELGIPFATFKEYATKTPGVSRQHGIWKLAPIG